MKKRISLITLACLFLGMVLGLLLKENVSKIEFLGSFYLSFLKFLITPVLFTSISVSIFDSAQNRASLVLKTIVLFVAMFIVSFLLSSAAVLLIDPAAGFSFIETDTAVQSSQIKVADIFLNLLPKDLLGFFTGKYLFFTIVVSYVVGMLAARLKAGALIEMIKKVRDFLYQILSWLTYYTPLAVLSLMAVTVHKFGLSTIAAGLKYIMTAYVCGVLVLAVVMVLPLKFIGKIQLKSLIKKIYPIWLMTLSTCSSAATLPYTIKLCKEELKIDPRVTDVVVPLGCTIHMCGGAVSFSLLGLFCARLFGVEVNLSMYVYMILISVALNMSAPGIPNGGVVIGATYLEMLGLPLSFIGLYAGIYKVLDMLYTTLNVTGDISANLILNSTLKKEEERAASH